MELLLHSVKPNVGKVPLILAVDDHEDNLLLLMEVLSTFECSVLTASNGESAVMLAQNYHPDLILLDIMLPDFNGVEVVHRLRQDHQTSQIPIIAVTALARGEDRDRLLFAGCNDYICKPYILDDLEAIICRYLPLMPCLA